MTWCKTCSDKPNREWDRTAAMMILQLVTESGHPVLGASSAFERGKLDIKEYGKKSSRFVDSEGNIEMLRRSAISVNQLSIHGFLEDWCKNWYKKSAPSSDRSESSGTLYAKAMLEMRRLYREYTQMPENARCSPGGNATISDTGTSTASAASTIKSVIRRRRKTSITIAIARVDGGITESHGHTRRQHLHLHLHLHLQLPQWPTPQWQSSWSSWQPTYISVSRKEFQKIDGRCRQYTHEHCTYSAVQSVHKRGTHRTRLAQELHYIFVRLKRTCHPVRTCLTLCCSLTCRLPGVHHLPHSLFLLPRHQNKQNNRDNTIYSKNTHYIMNLSRISQPTSSAIKNHSGVNAEWRKPAHNFLHRLWALRACDCLKDLQGNRSISIFLMVRKKLENKVTKPRSPKEWRTFGEIGTHVFVDSKVSETTYFQSHMHFDDSAEGIADSDLEDGELQKMLTSPLYAQKASEKRDAMVVQEREVSAQLTQADRKFEDSLIRRSESFRETRCIVHERKCSPKYSTPKYARNGRNKESSRTTNGWGLSAEVKRISRDNSAAHFPIAANARTDEFYGWFWRFSRCGIKWNWKDVSRFQSTCDDSEFSFHAWPRQRLPLDTWNQSGLQENVFGNQFFTFDSPRIIFSKNLIWRRAKKPGSSPWSRKDEDYSHKWRQTKIKAQFQCRHLHQGRWQRDLQYWWIDRRTSWSDSKDCKYRNCNSTNSPIHNRSWCGKFDSKHKSLLVFWFSIGCYVVDQRSGRSVSGKNFPNFDMLEAKIASALNKISRIPNSRTRSVSRNRKPRKRTGFYEEDRSPSWSTTTFEWLALMTQY